MHYWADKLFSYNKIYDHKGSEDLFVSAMKESILYHKANNELYNGLLERDNFDVDCIKSTADLHKIPTIPANFLKYHEVLSIKKEDVKVHATSSGTMGQKSQVFLDGNTLRRGRKMAIKVMWYHRLMSFLPTNYLILGYEPVKTNNKGNVQLQQQMTKFAYPKERVYALRRIGDDYELDYFGMINGLQRFNKQIFPVRIMGFPSYLYMLITMMKKAGIAPLKLNKKSVVMTGGGWKRHDDMMIDKSEYYQLIEDYLGIPKENCRDFYSAVEHSVAYPECKNHHMHVTIWSRVIVRDTQTLEPLGFDKPGFLNFISPFVSSQPISSIIMGDLGVLRDGSGCGCGIKTPYFEVLGRAGASRLKSCAIAANDYLKGK